MERRSRPHRGTFAQRRLNVALLAVVLWLPSVATAAPGDLDPTFGTGGKVVTPVGTSDDVVYSLVQQADGKLVAAGYKKLSTTNVDFLLVRYNLDGSLDSTFGTGGKVTTSIGSGFDVALALVQQADGKLVAAGHTDGATAEFALARYKTNGSLDTTFGVGGTATSAIGTGNDVANALVQQADGKLVAAGYSQGTTIDFALARFNANGTLDSTFGTGGKVVTPIGTSNDVANALVQQADGQLVAAGFTQGASADIALVRYNTNGTLDASFGVAGKVVTSIGSGNDVANSLIQQSDGRLVVAGSTVGATTDFAVVRYNLDGSLDGAFGVAGKVVTPIGASEDVAHAMVQETNGKLAVAGQTLGTNVDVAVVQYNPDGSLDASFGAGGKVITPIGSLDDVANALVRQADGKLVVAGYTTGTNWDVMLARYETFYLCGDGVTDPGEQCDDGNSINGDCCSATCQFEASGGACQSDGNVCTTDVCNGAGTCTHLNNTVSCDDGLFCNGVDTCSGGSCVHSGDPCPGPDGDANCAESCNETSDSCTAADPSGSACADDGNPCTTDTCSAGGCVHALISGCVTTTTTSTSTSTSSTSSTSSTTSTSSS